MKSLIRILFLLLLFTVFGLAKGLNGALTEFVATHSCTAVDSVQFSHLQPYHLPQTPPEPCLVDQIEHLAAN